MAHNFTAGRNRVIVLGLVVAAAAFVLSVPEQSANAADTTKGSAYAAEGHIALFGGPVNNCYYPAQPSSPCPLSLVTFPPGGTLTPASTKIVFGPAVFIRTGPATISSTGSTGTVTSSTSFQGTTGESNTPCLFSYPANFTAGSPIVTSATANFTAEDVGRTVTNANLPPTGTHPNQQQIATIVSVQSPTQATLSLNAATSATGSFLSIDRGVGNCIYFSQFTADTVASTCTATASGVTGSTTFTNGQLITLTDDYQQPTVVVPIPDNPAPNTTMDGVFYLNGTPEPFRYVFNEQDIDPVTGALTVYAVHLIALPDTSGSGGGNAVGDVYLGASTCGATTAVTTTSTTGGVTTTSSTSTTLPSTTTSSTSTTLPSTTTSSTSTTRPSTTTSSTSTSTTRPTTSTTSSVSNSPYCVGLRAQLARTSDPATRTGIQRQMQAAGCGAS